MGIKSYQKPRIGLLLALLLTTQVVKSDPALQSVYMLPGDVKTINLNHLFGIAPSTSNQPFSTNSPNARVISRGEIAVGSLGAGTSDCTKSQVISYKDQGGIQIERLVVACQTLLFQYSIVGAQLKAVPTYTATLPSPISDFSFDTRSQEISVVSIKNSHSSPNSELTFTTVTLTGKINAQKTLTFKNSFPNPVFGAGLSVARWTSPDGKTSIHFAYTQTTSTTQSGTGLVAFADLGSKSSAATTTGFLDLSTDKAFAEAVTSITDLGFIGATGLLVGYNSQQNQNLAIKNCQVVLNGLNSENNHGELFEVGLQQKKKKLTVSLTNCQQVDTAALKVTQGQAIFSSDASQVWVLDTQTNGNLNICTLFSGKTLGACSPAKLKLRGLTATQIQKTAQAPIVLFKSAASNTNQNEFGVVFNIRKEFKTVIYDTTTNQNVVSVAVTSINLQSPRENVFFLKNGYYTTFGLTETKYLVLHANDFMVKDDEYMQTKITVYNQRGTGFETSKQLSVVTIKDLNTVVTAPQNFKVLYTDKETSFLPFNRGLFNGNNLNLKVNNYTVINSNKLTLNTDSFGYDVRFINQNYAIGVTETAIQQIVCTGNLVDNNNQCKKVAGSTVALAAGESVTGVYPTLSRDAAFNGAVVLIQGSDTVSAVYLAFGSGAALTKVKIPSLAPSQYTNAVVKLLGSRLMFFFVQDTQITVYQSTSTDLTKIQKTAFVLDATTLNLPQFCPTQVFVNNYNLDVVEIYSSCQNGDSRLIRLGTNSGALATVSSKDLSPFEAEQNDLRICAFGNKYLIYSRRQQSLTVTNSANDGSYQSLDTTTAGYYTLSGVECPLGAHAALIHGLKTNRYTTQYSVILADNLDDPRNLYHSTGNLTMFLRASTTENGLLIAEVTNKNSVQYTEITLDGPHVYFNGVIPTKSQSQVPYSLYRSNPKKPVLQTNYAYTYLAFNPAVQIKPKQTNTASKGAFKLTDLVTTTGPIFDLKSSSASVQVIPGVGSDPNFKPSTGTAPAEFDYILGGQTVSIGCQNTQQGLNVYLFEKQDQLSNKHVLVPGDIVDYDVDFLNTETQIFTALKAKGEETELVFSVYSWRGRADFTKGGFVTSIDFPQKIQASNVYIRTIDANRLLVVLVDTERKIASVELIEARVFTLNNVLKAEFTQTHLTQINQGKSII